MLFSQGLSSLDSGPHGHLAHCVTRGGCFQGTLPAKATRRNLPALSLNKYPECSCWFLCVGLGRQSPEQESQATKELGAGEL